MHQLTGVCISIFDIFDTSEVDIYSRRFFYFTTSCDGGKVLSAKPSLRIKKELESIEEYEKELGERIKEFEARLEAKELDDKVKAMQVAIRKTYLTLWFNSEGKTPTSVIMKLQDIGFKPTRGEHDFVYHWKQEIELKEIHKLRDTIHKTLKGSKVLYKLETP